MSSHQKLLEYPTRILVFGTRNFEDETFFHIKMVQVLRTRYGETPNLQDLNSGIAFMSGAAHSGADAMIIRWAAYFNFYCEKFPADWDKYKMPSGKNPAGMIRNAEMAKFPTHAVSFWDGIGTGTEDMRKRVLERDCLFDEFRITHG